MPRSAASAETVSLMAQTLAPASQKTRKSQIKKYVEWLKETAGDTQSPYLRADGTVRVAAVLANDDDAYFAYLYHRFGMTVEELEDGTEEILFAGDRVGFGTLSSFRTAFEDLVKADPDCDWTEEQVEKKRRVYRTMKRLDGAQKKRLGEGTAKAGKDPLPFGLYQRLAEMLVTSARRQEFWAHSFVVIAWNTMSRAGNGATVALTDIASENDAFLIRFAQTKGDQRSQKAHIPKHVFANPFDPTICPVLALGLHLLGHDGSQPLVFEVDGQDRRFSAVLRRFWNSADGQKALQDHGKTAGEIGTHSIRKGSSSFAASGTTASTSAIAWLTRGGWSTGSAWEAYSYMMPGADCYIGRILAGLDPLDRSFAILPPHFDPSDPLVKNAVEQVFGGITSRHQHFWLVGSALLASLVHHAEWVKQNTPPFVSEHYLFNDAQLLRALRERLITGYQSPFMKPSGIPPHVMTMATLEKLVEGQVQAREQLMDLTDSMVARLEATLDRRTVEQGGITPQYVKTLVEGAVVELKRAVTDAAGTIASPARVNDEAHSHSDSGASNPYDAIASSDPAPSSSSAATGDQQASAAFRGPHAVVARQWNGNFHLVDEDWTLPKTGLSRSFQLWCVGSGDTPPYRYLLPMDRRGHRREYSEWRVVFSRIEMFLRRRGKWIDRPTLRECDLMYDAAKPLLQHLFPRSKRLNHLRPSWAIKRLRKLEEDDLNQLADTLPST